ncbi:MAG: roadblock/LC7 domain-containing protein [Desulfuromonadales bacterium]
MSFRPVLNDLMQKVPGAQGVILADWEGEAVDQAARIDDYQLQVFGAHKGIVLTNLREVVQRDGEDHLREIVITTEKNKFLVLPITKDYFLLMLLERGSVLSRALFAARTCVQRLYPEIA